MALNHAPLEHAQGQLTNLTLIDDHGCEIYHDFLSKRAFVPNSVRTLIEKMQSVIDGLAAQRIAAQRIHHQANVRPANVDGVADSVPEYSTWGSL